MRDISFSRLSWFGSLGGGIAFYGSLSLFVAGGHLTKGSMSTIEWFSSNPERFRAAYLLQAAAFLV